jgi:hypothetical protein
MSDGWFTLAETVAEALDVGPGSRIFEIDCGAGDFLQPFYLNGYAVGGADPDADAIEQARIAMPHGMFQVGAAPALDPAVPWHVVVWRLRRDAADGSRPAVAEVDDVRGVLARMFAKATHAIALLDVPGDRRQWMMHALAELGAATIQFEGAGHERFNVFVRV